MNKRFSPIGMTFEQAQMSGSFIRKYSDLALYNYQMGDTRLLLFRCVNGFVAFGNGATKLKQLGYAQRYFGEYKLNYATFPTEDFKYVITLFKRNISWYASDKEESNQIVNFNKSIKTNFLLFSMFMS